jgi:hypothetical protein
MLSNAFAAGSNGPGTTTSTHARCQEGALRRGHATDSGRHLAVRVVSRSQLHDHELLGLVILKVSVDRDARADRDLLGEIAGAEDVARIAEVNEMVAAIGAEHVSLVAPLPERQSLGDGTVIQVSSRSLIVESLYQFAHAAHRARLSAIGKLVRATRRRI